ncbi:hypothetical protein [Kocuria sp.]|uniref:hypothetical protein n=1 Tax=Kocuria sp. TaxID=1871328 RepID=UPI0026DB8638|nr:hypothetical protein [Kocuria sp.]MDO4920090.1 hypothetical protein [Kocuria sp.]
MKSYELPLGQQEVSVSVDLSDRDAEALGLKSRAPENKARTPANKAVAVDHEERTVEVTDDAAAPEVARRPGHKPRGGK